MMMMMMMMMTITMTMTIPTEGDSALTEIEPFVVLFSLYIRYIVGNTLPLVRMLPSVPSMS